MAFIGIYILEKNYPRNAWFEMLISTVVHIWSKNWKNTNVIPSVQLKTIRRYLINNKLTIIILKFLISFAVLF
jgi:hypothetical protein